MRRVLGRATLFLLMFGLSGGLVLPDPVLCQDAGLGRIMVYLEVPGESAPQTTLSLATMSIVSDGKALRLKPEIRRLDSILLNDRQVLLVDAELPAGMYEQIVLVLDQVTTAVGSAEISPEVRGTGYALAIDGDVEAGGCKAVFLRWRPSLETGRAQPYEPFLEVLGDRVPPLGSLALVTCRDTGCLVAYDRTADRIVNMVRIGDDPRDIVYLRDQQKVMIALAGEDALVVVDGLSLRIERKVPMRFGDDPDRLALSAGLDHLYVLCPGSRSLAVVATFSLQERNRVALGDEPRSLTVDPESGHIYVACEGAGQVQVIDPISGSVVSVLTPTSAPREVVFDEVTRQLFVGSASQRKIFVYRFLDGGGLESQSICGHADGLAYNPQTQQVFAAMSGCREIAVTRPALGLEFASLPMPVAPSRLAFDANHRQLFILFSDAGALAVCSPQRGVVGDLVMVGGRPYGVVAP